MDDAKIRVRTLRQIVAHPSPVSSLSIERTAMGEEKFD